MYSSMHSSSTGTAVHRLQLYEMKPEETATVPAAACVANLSPGFSGTVALGQFSFSKTISIFYFGTNSAFI